MPYSHLINSLRVALLFNTNKPHLEWLFPRVYELMSLQLGALHERLATLCTHMHPGPVGVQVLPHRRVVPEHLTTSLQRGDTEDRLGTSVAFADKKRERLPDAKGSNTWRTFNGRHICMKRLTISAFIQRA